MSAEIALQEAIRLLLIGAGAITALVPAASILDRNSRPAPVPSIVIGEGISQDDGSTIARDRLRIVMDIHIWKREPSTEGVKQIAGAIRTAIKAARLALADGHHCIDCRFASSRFLRDPDGEHSHAVLMIEALVKEAS